MIKAYNPALQAFLMESTYKPERDNELYTAGLLNNNQALLVTYFSKKTSVPLMERAQFMWKALLAKQTSDDAVRSAIASYSAADFKEAMISFFNPPGMMFFRPKKTQAEKNDFLSKVFEYMPFSI